MSLKELARIPLPPHPADGGFDHAAVHIATSQLYVAHPSNDCVDVVDLAARRYLRSLPALRGVAGVWVSQEHGLMFTSNRGEDTASIFRLPEEREQFRVSTGSRPNGMAFDDGRKTLLVAGVGNPATGEPPTATLVAAGTGERLRQLALPGRTRWATYHRTSDVFLVNIAAPPTIAVIEPHEPWGVARFIEIPATGPHGMEQDPDGRTIYCACDDGGLVTVDLPTGNARVAGTLAGSPDVLWLNSRVEHLYVAIGDPGVVQVFRTNPLELVESVRTGPGAHTLTVDPSKDEIHVFLPETHEDLVLRDGKLDCPDHVEARRQSQPFEHGPRALGGR
ncbi:MAG: YncE family protein [Thermoplasmata archaeon]